MSAKLPRLVCLRRCSGHSRESRETQTCSEPTPRNRAAPRPVVSADDPAKSPRWIGHVFTNRLRPHLWPHPIHHPARGARKITIDGSAGTAGAAGVSGGHPEISTRNNGTPGPAEALVLSRHSNRGNLLCRRQRRTPHAPHRAGNLPSFSWRKARGRERVAGGHSGKSS